MIPQTAIFDAANNCWLFFANAIKTLNTHRVDEIPDLLRHIESEISRNHYWAAGFVSYEAASAFDPALSTHSSDDFPLLWFGIYEQPRITSSLTEISENDLSPLDWSPTISRENYDSSIARVKHLIAQGDTYQVNFTLRLRAEIGTEFSPWDYFRLLTQSQPVGYGAYIDTGEHAICSVSPELFFRLEGDRLTTLPMKGTARRGRTTCEDARLSHWLQNSEKNRAENVMIVDMMRNDFGKIAVPGSVAVPELFKLERYPTVWQMVSEVAAATDASFCDIMTAFFPAASVTGAPKPRTMKIISELESDPRRIYTGTIGFLAPGRRAQFNVAIRTVLIDKAKGVAEYGVGGGIVWDSQTDEEYDECLTKAQVLTKRVPEFSLLETMRWSPDEGYFLLDRHLRRLTDSADYFGFSISLEKIRAQLGHFASSLVGHNRVRLLVSKSGGVVIEHQTIVDSTQTAPVRLRISPGPVDSGDVFLYHKTTNRSTYDNARSQFHDCDDVILWNQLGELTETCLFNIVIRKTDGSLITPQISSGLLAGTYREFLLEQGRIREEIVTLDDLKSAAAVFVINSVRGWREAILID